MKFFPATAVVALATTLVSAQTCVLVELATQLSDFIAPASSCQAATGYVLIPPTALPTPAQVAAICSQCQDLIVSARQMTFPTCTIAIGGQEVAFNTLISEVIGQCSASGSSSAASDTVGSNSTMRTTSSSGSNSGDVATPPATTTAPPATPTTAPPATTTSAGAMATFGATLAVACSVAALVL